MTIAIKAVTRDITHFDFLNGSMFLHDCYDQNDYRIETDTFYAPTPQQIDQNTDNDELAIFAVCNVCQEEMPNLNVVDEHYGAIYG